MNSDHERWTQEQKLQALKAFFESPDGKRFLDVFSSDCSAEEREIFLRDAERRSKHHDEEAGRWWNSLSSLVKNNPKKFLTLTEPLAQTGVDIEDLYNCLPENFDASALTQAISQARNLAVGGPAAGITNTEGWSEDQIRARLEEVKPQLGFADANIDCLNWWEDFETNNESQLSGVLRIAEELLNRKATLTAFVDAYYRSKSGDVQANLHYFDYQRVKEREKGAAHPAGVSESVRPGLTTDDSGWWLRPAPGITRVRGWTDEMIKNRLEEVKAKIGWDDADEKIRQWWEEFERGNFKRPALVLRLAEEIVKRGATLTDFYNAYRDSGAENVHANLFFLDYLLLKRNEENKKQEREKEKRDQAAREENRRKIREEKVAMARDRFDELRPLLEMEQSFSEISETDKTILSYFPRIEIPEGLRESFDRLIESFEYETLTLDEMGQTVERRRCTARRLIEELIPGVTLEMVEIPGGKFLMGTADEDVQKVIDEYTRYRSSKKDVQELVDRERPQHEVTVAPFYIGKFVVTQDHWNAVASWEKVERDLDPDPAHFKGDDRPVEQVSWEEAQEFCARLSRKTGSPYRLPTEAEWEYACRAGTTTPFSFGETITPEFVNYNGNFPYAKAEKGEYRQETVSVGKLGMPNAFGLFDMHGNVWEWCEDVWHDNYDGAPSDGSAWLSEGDSTNRMLRGGSYDNYGRVCRSAVRSDNVPGVRGNIIGFRVVVSARAS